MCLFNRKTRRRSSSRQSIADPQVQQAQHVERAQPGGSRLCSRRSSPACSTYRWAARSSFWGSKACLSRWTGAQDRMAKAKASGHFIVVVRA